MGLTSSMLKMLFRAITEDVESGNSKLSHDELKGILDTVADGVVGISKSIQTDYFDRLTLMDKYGISKREFYRLLKSGLLKEERLPSSTKKVYAKTEMDNLVAQKLVKPLKNKV